MNENELLNCPFCGGNKLEVIQHHQPMLNGDGVIEEARSVRCLNSDCRCSLTTCAPNKEEAIKVWNTRTTPKSTEAEGDKERLLIAVNKAREVLINVKEAYDYSERIDGENYSTENFHLNSTLELIDAAIANEKGK